MPVEFTPGLSDEQKRNLGLLPPEDALTRAKRAGEPLRDLNEPPPPPPMPEPVPEPEPHSSPIEVPSALVTRINGATEIKLRDGRRILRTDGSNAGELAAKKEEVIEGLASRMGQLRSWAQQMDRGTKPNIPAGRLRRGESPVDAWIDTIARIYSEMGMENDVRTILRDFANAEGLVGDLEAKVRTNKEKAEAEQKEKLAASWKELDAIPEKFDAFDEMLVAAPATGEKKLAIVAILDSAITTLNKLKADFSTKFERVDSIFVERAKLQAEGLRDYFNRLYGTYGNTLPQSLLDFTKDTLALILSSESRTAAAGLLRGKRGVPTIAEMHEALNHAQMPKVKNLSEFCVLLKGVPEVPTNLGTAKKSGKEAADFIRQEVVLGMDSDAFAKKPLEERSETIERFRAYFGTADGVLSKMFHKLLNQIDSVKNTYQELIDEKEQSIIEIDGSFRAFIASQQQELEAALTRDRELRAVIAAPDADAAAKSASAAELPSLTKKITETHAAINENYYKIASDIGTIVRDERSICIKAENAEMETYCKKRYAALRLFQEEFARFSTVDGHALEERFAAALNGDSWKDEVAPKATAVLDAAELDRVRGEIASFNIKRTGKRTGPDGKDEWYVTDEDIARAKREVTESQIKAHLEMWQRPRTLGKEAAKDKLGALFEGVTTKDDFIERLSGISQGDALDFIKSRPDRETIVSSLRDEFLKQFSRFKDGAEFNARPKEQKQRIVVEYLNSLPATARRIFKPVFETELFSGERLEGVNMEKGAAGEPVPKAEAGPQPSPQTSGEIVHSELWNAVGEEKVSPPARTPAGGAVPAGGSAPVAEPVKAEAFKPTSELWKNVGGSDAAETAPVPSGGSTESASSGEDELRALVDQVSYPLGFAGPVLQCYNDVREATTLELKREAAEKYRASLLPQLPELAKNLRTHAALFATLVTKLNVPELAAFPKLGIELASIAESATPDLVKFFIGLEAYVQAKNSIELEETKPAP